MNFVRNVAICLSMMAMPLGVLAQQPLSCKMQVMLHMVEAELRDAGHSKESAIKRSKETGELTDKEIKEITNNVWVKYKNRTPKEIGEIIYKKCA